MNSAGFAIENWFMPIFLVVALGAGICYYFMKKNKNRKAAQTGEDKAHLRRAAAPLLSAGGKFLYAHWEKREHYGRTTKTTFYRYLVTFQDQALYIAPLYVDKKTHQMQAGQPSIFTPENLGKVTVSTRRKNGEVDHIDLWLCDKQGKTLFQLYVDTENLRKDRFHPVNIVQAEECAAFEAFLTSLSGRVADENPGVDDLIKADNNESLGLAGMILSIIGAALSIFFAPVGGVLSMLGLVLTIVSKAKGAKSKKYLIISIVCFIVSAVLAWVSLTYLI